MARLLYGHSEAVITFVATVLGKPRGHAPGVGVGVLDESGLLVAGLVFYDLRPSAGRVELAVAGLPGRPWLTKGAARAAAAFAFEHLGCEVIIAWTDLDNRRARKAARVFGATDHEIPSMGQSLLVLTRDNYEL